MFHGQTYDWCPHTVRLWYYCYKWMAAWSTLESASHLTYRYPLQLTTRVKLSTVCSSHISILKLLTCIYIIGFKKYYSIAEYLNNLNGGMSCDCLEDSVALHFANILAPEVCDGKFSTHGKTDTVCNQSHMILKLLLSWVARRISRS